MSQPTRILLSLVLGLVIGVLLAAQAPGAVPGVLLAAEPVGTAWLNALQMTIVPLVVSLLITGIAATAEAVRAGRTAARGIAVILSVMSLSAILAAVLTPLLLELAPLPAESAASLRSALVGVPETGPVPGLSAFFAGLVPTNVVAAAANSAYISLLIFTLLFAFALTRIEAEPRERLTGFFTGVRDTVLVMVNWIIWAAPLGVFALALTVGARAGSAAFGALVHYILIVSAVGVVVTLLAYPMAMFGGRVHFARFARAAAPAQAVAVSTQSSLACLPIMLKKAEELGVPAATGGVVLPLAVVMMRATGPAMNLAVAIYAATWFGIQIGPATLMVATVVAMLTSLGSVSLPGQVSFISAIAPINAVFGVPVAPLGLLVAVETLPDIVRTLGNVTMDLAVTTAVAARSGAVPVDEADALLARG
ncbi:dicarboxylate/amino acid:cation symporter [Sphingomonas sp.]|uniref:dicarboxylate/amino acid:cation symporter n=1 Tax=Sphingomonas sp. TaxID=28214 RepID=UPI002ED9F1EF